MVVPEPPARRGGSLGAVAQLARAPALQAGGRGFESHQLHELLSLDGVGRLGATRGLPPVYTGRLRTRDPELHASASPAMGWRNVTSVDVEPIRSALTCMFCRSAQPEGFESRPLGSTRCRSHNVSPGRRLFLVAPRKPTYSRSSQTLAPLTRVGGIIGRRGARLRQPPGGAGPVGRVPGLRQNWRSGTDDRCCRGARMVGVGDVCESRPGSIQLRRFVAVSARRPGGSPILARWR